MLGWLASAIIIFGQGQDNTLSKVSYTVLSEGHVVPVGFVVFCVYPAEGGWGDWRGGLVYVHGMALMFC